MEQIEVVTAVDGHYLRQLAVMLASLDATSTRPCRVHILHTDVPPHDRQKLQPTASDLVAIRWHDVGALLEGRPLPRSRPRSMFYRLFMGEIGDLPERVVYLDADVIVRRPLDELWEAELLDAPLAAVRDAFRPWIVCDYLVDWRSLDAPPDAPLFNSGVMVVSLAEWRGQSVGTRALALLSEESHRVDQSALNVVLAGGWVPLHPRWNVQSYHLTGDGCLAYATEGRDRLEEALADPAIVHFTGGSFNRPWEAPCGNPYVSEWLGLLDRTGWSGWRPKPSSAPARAYRRAARAARVLRHGGRGEA